MLKAFRLFLLPLFFFTAFPLWALMLTSFPLSEKPILLLKRAAEEASEIRVIDIEKMREKEVLYDVSPGDPNFSRLLSKDEQSSVVRLLAGTREIPLKCDDFLPEVKLSFLKEGREMFSVLLSFSCDVWAVGTADSPDVFRIGEPVGDLKSIQKAISKLVRVPLRGRP
jgi:hypothetical protein